KGSTRLRRPDIQMPQVLRAVPVREYGAEQPVRLAVDPVGEVEGIGIAVTAADPELEGPKPARRVALADIDRDRPTELSGRRGEGAVEYVDAAGRCTVGGIKARLCAVDRQPGVGGPGGRDLDKGRWSPVPGRNGSVQIGEDESRGTTVSAIVHRERRGVDIA